MKKGNWSDEEQDLIFQALMDHQTSWSAMSKILRGRTENSIKNYFYSSVRRVKSSPIMDELNAIFVERRRAIPFWTQIYDDYEAEILRFN